ELALEALDGRAQDEAGLRHHRVEGGLPFPLDRAVLGRQVQERHVHRSPSPRKRRSRPGTPATTARAATSRVTTAPAPTRAPSPIVTPARMTAPEPMEAPRQTRVGTTAQSASVWRAPPSLVARGKRSLTKQTWWPMKQSSSMVTPSQMKVCELTLQRAPTWAFFWTSTNVPILLSSPT